MTPRAPWRVLPGSPFNVTRSAVPAECFAVDDRVSHDRHGLGRVVALEGDALVCVDFGSEVRRISLPNPKLTKL